MVRKLKHHEQKLLKKVDFTTYKSDSGHRAAQVQARYAVSKGSDYTAYNRLSGSLRCVRCARQLAHKLAALDPADPVRARHEALLLEKLHDMGLLGEVGLGGTGKLSQVENKVGVSAFCRRRLGVVMARLGMADGIVAANRFIEQGHVRVGTSVVTDPAFLVTRNMEDFVTWVDSSRIKRSILRYRDKLDDFDLM